jgi:hypothetical protein
MTPSLDDRASQRLWRLTLALIAGATIAKLIYLLAFCPYTLVEDEAHYWEWSRRLDWSYYTKGPGIAATIHLTTAAFRALGLELTEAAVRLAAPIASAVLMLALATLTRDITRSSRAALLAVVLVLLAPGLHITSLLITIDGPYAACWAAAALFAHRALRRRAATPWILAGLCIGLGFTYKYTILLLPPGIALWAVLNRPHLRLHPRWKPLAIAALAAATLGLVPVLIWNLNNDWGTIKHLMGHLGLAGGDQPQATHKPHYSPTWTLVLIAAQLGLVGPALLLIASPHALTITPETPRATEPVTLPRPDRDFLLAAGLPVFILYLGVSFIAEPEGNWPLAGHLTLIPLLAVAIVRLKNHLESRRQAFWSMRTTPRRRGLFAITSGQPQSAANIIWILALFAGIGFVLASIRLDKVAQGPAMQAIERLAARLSVIEPGRPIIPLGRIMFADRIAADADARLKAIASETKQQPFLIAQHYGRASQLAFYIPSHPTVHCSSSQSDGRVTQYDKWTDTSLNDPVLLNTLRGRPALLVGGRLDQWAPAFESVTELPPLDGETKRGRLTFLGTSFRGFPPNNRP